MKKIVREEITIHHDRLTQADIESWSVERASRTPPETLFKVRCKKTTLDAYAKLCFGRDRVVTAGGSAPAGEVKLSHLSTAAHSIDLVVDEDIPSYATAVLESYVLLPPAYRALSAVERMVVARVAWGTLVAACRSEGWPVTPWDQLVDQGPARAIVSSMELMLRQEIEGGRHRFAAPADTFSRDRGGDQRYALYCGVVRQLIHALALLPGDGGQVDPDDLYGRV